MPQSVTFTVTDIQETIWPTIQTTANLSVPRGDTVVEADASGGAITITLPGVALAKDRVIVVTKVDSSANSVTVDGDGADTINGQLTQVITQQNVAITMVSNGSTWRII